MIHTVHFGDFLFCLLTPPGIVPFPYPRSFIFSRNSCIIVCILLEYFSQCLKIFYCHNYGKRKENPVLPFWGLRGWNKMMKRMLIFRATKSHLKRQRHSRVIKLNGSEQEKLCVTFQRDPALTSLKKRPDNSKFFKLQPINSSQNAPDFRLLSVIATPKIDDMNCGKLKFTLSLNHHLSVQILLSWEIYSHVAPVVLQIFNITFSFSPLL